MSSNSIIYLPEKYLLENRLFTKINDSSVISPHYRDNQEFTGDHLPGVCQLSQLQTLRINLLNHYIKLNKPAPIRSNVSNPLQEDFM